MLDFVGRAKHLPENPFFLYPPNVAVMDFLLGHADSQDRILDYGCGLGNLLLYLRRMGFVNAFGYDDFSQIKPSTVRSFSEKFETSRLVLSKQEALHFRASIAVCVCYFWKGIDKDLIQKEMASQGLRYLLLDWHYAPRHIKGFKIAGVYPNLLIVFERIA